MHPLARGIDLESAEATDIHRRLIREKPFLRLLYERYYSEFLHAHAASPAGTRLEIGSGGGFLMDLLPGLITVDLRPGTHVSITASALELPFGDNKVGAVFMLNTLHHLPDPYRFFNETRRILKPGGRCVMIEPFVSPVSKSILTHLHHEPFNPESVSWTSRVKGPQAGANMALPWIIFIRDRKRFERLYPELKIIRTDPHTILLYVVSGGVSMKALLPQCCFKPLAWVEKRLGPLKPYLCIMMTVEIQRIESIPKTFHA